MEKPERLIPETMLSQSERHSLKLQAQGLIDLSERLKKMINLSEEMALKGYALRVSETAGLKEDLRESISEVAGDIEKYIDVMKKSVGADTFKEQFGHLLD